jgi:ribonuclease D
VTDAGWGLAHHSQTLLSVVLPKLNLTRCSTWSNKSPRQDQIQYAAADVIKRPDIFLELQKQPDLA